MKPEDMLPSIVPVEEKRKEALKFLLLYTTIDETGQHDGTHSLGSYELRACVHGRTSLRSSRGPARARRTTQRGVHAVAKQRQVLYLSRQSCSNSGRFGPLAVRHSARTRRREPARARPCCHVELEEETTPQAKQTETTIAICPTLECVSTAQLAHSLRLPYRTYPYASQSVHCTTRVWAWES
jgi:hypothetical protein